MNMISVGVLVVMKQVNINKRFCEVSQLGVIKEMNKWPFNVSYVLGSLVAEMRGKQVVLIMEMGLKSALSENKNEECLTSPKQKHRKL